MFTGIIRETGIVQKTGKTLGIRSHQAIKNKQTGDSIAVDGVCLTITKIKKNNFETEIMAETRKRTTLGCLEKGQKVNLEPAAKYGDRVNGHLVSGHVDSRGEVLRAGKTLKIKFPRKFRKYMAWKGSVAINGVSLTITGLSKNILEVKLIQHTIKNTNLGKLKKGDKVNIEVDILARYLEQLLNEAKK